MKRILVELLGNSNSVNLITEENGRKKERLISVEDFIESLKASTKRKKTDEFKPVISPLLRRVNDITLIQTKQVGKNSYFYILHSERKQATFPIFNRFYGNVGIPNLLFGVQVVNNRVSRLYIVATKDKDITLDSKLYLYPFSNVGTGSGSVCLGGNNINNFDVTERDNLFKVVDMFFSMPNNTHMYSNDKNTMRYEYEEMLQALDNKLFDDSLLVENKGCSTYREWIEKL